MFTPQTVLAVRAPEIETSYSNNRISLLPASVSVPADFQYRVINMSLYRDAVLPVYKLFLTQIIH